VLDPRLNHVVAVSRPDRYRGRRDVASPNGDHQERRDLERQIGYPSFIAPRAARSSPNWAATSSNARLASGRSAPAATPRAGGAHAASSHRRLSASLDGALPTRWSACSPAIQASASMSAAQASNAWFSNSHGASISRRLDAPSALVDLRRYTLASSDAALFVRRDHPCLIFRRHLAIWRNQFHQSIRLPLCEVIRNLYDSQALNAQRLHWSTASDCPKDRGDVGRHRRRRPAHGTRRAFRRASPPSTPLNSSPRASVLRDPRGVKPKPACAPSLPPVSRRCRP